MTVLPPQSSAPFPSTLPRSRRHAGLLLAHTPHVDPDTSWTSVTRDYFTSNSARGGSRGVFRGILSVSVFELGVN